MSKVKPKIEENKFLPIVALVPEKVLPSKYDIEKLIKGKKEINQGVVNDYYNWLKSKNEMVIFCGYGQDVPKIPTKYDYLIDFNHPDKLTSVEATVRFALWDGLIPLDFIEFGQKTICIISFREKIPAELAQLPSWEDYQKGAYQYDKFGLC